LARQRTQTASRTDNRNELARLRTRLLQALVHSDTSAKNRGNGVERAFLGDASNVRGFGDAVLLESAVDSVAGELGLGAQRLVGLLAEVTGEAGAVEPFDAGVVADFNVLDEVAFGDDDAGTFVAAYEG
jgi:hypothetical protein